MPHLPQRTSLVIQTAEALRRGIAGGEWSGYLHRDGRVSSRAKGTLWKGPFHLPRMLWYCWQRLESAKVAPIEARSTN